MWFFCFYTSFYMWSSVFWPESSMNLGKQYQVDCALLKKRQIACMHEKHITYILGGIFTQNMCVFGFYTSFYTRTWYFIIICINWIRIFTMLNCFEVKEGTFEFILRNISKKCLFVKAKVSRVPYIFNTIIWFLLQLNQLSTEIRIETKIPG